MSIRALRYLIALADCLNFTRAAERCCVTQSTLSIQLRKLEEYLGVVLFDRDRAHVALTADGEHILRFARVAVRAADRMVTVSRAAQRRQLAAAQSCPDQSRPPQSRPGQNRPTDQGRLIEEINCEVGPWD